MDKAPEGARLKVVECPGGWWEATYQDKYGGASYRTRKGRDLAILGLGVALGNDATLHEDNADAVEEREG